ncbi:MAG: nucleotidyltransferase domain-containing protein, partial [Hadesarchaea archaeon]|nr:nucleotidyltransferase domain-containing protein [Hadesarchaea archaeon]
MVKPLRTVSEKEIEYEKRRWDLLDGFREKTHHILSILKNSGVNALVHGSVARGDVNKDSDIDIIIPNKTPSYKVELAIEESDLKPVSKEIVMATPWQLPKAHIDLGDNELITIPLLEPKKLESEFYQFGGAIGLNEINNEERAPGIDKRLVLIEPT